MHPVTHLTARFMGVTEELLELFAAHEAVITALGSASMLMFVVSFIAVPAVIIRLPADWFTEAAIRARYVRRQEHWARSLVRTAGRNVLAGILLSAGIAMLILPGQGLITILMALLVASFPGKMRLEYRIMSLASVRRTVNWIRRRAHREPFSALPHGSPAEPPRPTRPP